MSPGTVQERLIRRRKKSSSLAVKKKRKRLSTLIITGCIVAAGIALALVYRPALTTRARLDPTGFPAPVIERGATLAAIGYCAVCHTSETGAPYAGGRPLPTPFGTMYATNITPDEATGIGSWSIEAFRRAMRDGVSRDGQHLYPVFPYDHFACVDEDDLDAIYAFLMTRQSVSENAPPNDMIFPLGFRPLLAGWKLLFLHNRCFAKVSGQSEEWNRGAYLVEGLGHCGGCHRPRNIAGAEERGRPYSGGVAEGWNAPALDVSNPAPNSWTVEALYTYLRNGIDSDHSAAAGPMAAVVHELATIPEADVKAIALYVASLMQSRAEKAAVIAPSDNATEAARRHPQGAALFVGACGACHDAGAPMAMQGRPALSLVSAIQEDDPRNTIQTILQGLQLAAGDHGPYMPAFADSLSDKDIIEIAAYLRSRYSARSAWSELKNVVTQVRKEDAQP